jgi:hypothetical protein
MYLSAAHGMVVINYIFAIQGMVSGTSYIILHNNAMNFFAHGVSFHPTFYLGTKMLGC